MRGLDAVKWVATVVLIIGSAVASAGFYPGGPIVLLVGGALWLWAAVLMRDVQLMVTNGAMFLASSVPLLWVLTR